MTDYRINDMIVTEEELWGLLQVSYHTLKMNIENVYGTKGTCRDYLSDEKFKHTELCRNSPRSNEMAGILGSLVGLWKEASKHILDESIVDFADKHRSDLLWATLSRCNVEMVM